MKMFGTSLGIDLLQVSASILAPCKHPSGIKIHVFYNRLFNDFGDRNFIEMLPQMVSKDRYAPPLLFPYFFAPVPLGVVAWVTLVLFWLHVNR